jgi:hypothetical protein
MITTRPEQNVLFCVARRDLDERRHGELRTLLAAPLDWDYLISAARKHGLIPLLYRHVNSIPCNIERSQFDALKRESLENCQSVLHLVGRLSKLLKLFNESGISILGFKGPTLAQQAYGESSLRQAGDLDVLVQRTNFEVARKLLESLGYRMVPTLTPSQLAAHLNFHCEIPFVRDNFFTVIDLHWSLMPKAFPVEFDSGEMIERSQLQSIGGTRVNTFCAEDLILFQCVHGAKHYWSRLEWIASLAELIRNQEKIDWDKLILSARVVRASRMLALGLNLAKQLGDIQIPDSVIDRIDLSGSMRTLARETLESMFDEAQTDYPSIRAIRKNVQIMDRKRDVLMSMVRVVFVPTLSDWESLTLPESLHRFYYIVRPLRLMKSYSVSLFRRIIFGKERRTAAMVANPVEEQFLGGVID